MAAFTLPARTLRLPIGRTLLSTPRRLALFSTSSAARNATPDWEQLIGGRAGIDRRRAAFEDRYRAALEARAKKEGVSVEQLKERAKQLNAKPRAADVMRPGGIVRGSTPANKDPELGPVEAGSMDTRKTVGELSNEADAADVVKPLPSAEQEAAAARPKQPFTPKKNDSPIKVRFRGRLLSL